MARFTMTIQDIYTMYIWENNETLTDLSPQSVMDYGTPYLFDFPFNVPVDLQTFYNAFNNRYYFKEIGFETVDVFKMKLNYTININAEKYEMLYKDLLASWQMRNQNQTLVTNENNQNTSGANSTQDNRVITQNVSGQSSGSGNDTINGNTSNNQNTRIQNTGSEAIRNNTSQIFSDTPDNRLNNLTINPNNDRFSLNYASTLQDVLVRSNTNSSVDQRNTGTTSSTNVQQQATQTNTNTTQNSQETHSGGTQVNQSSSVISRGNQSTTFTYSSDITTYRNFLEVYQPILKMILDDLEPLFMGIF